MKRITVNLSEEDYNKLKELSKAYKKPMTEVLRTAIRDTHWHADCLGFVSMPKDKHNHFRVNGKNRKYGH